MAVEAFNGRGITFLSFAYDTDIFNYGEIKLGKQYILRRKIMGVKIKTLLEGLSGKGIQLNTTALAKFTADNGVLVTLRCGRRRGRVSLPPKLLGLRPEKWDEKSKDFFADHVAMGQLTMVPKELDAKLNQLDTRARRLVQSYTVNGSYMPLTQYDEFREAFEVIRREYMDTIREIARQWEGIRASFESGVRATVEARTKRTMTKVSREHLIKEIMNAVPTAKQYEEDAYMKVEVRAFPSTGSAALGLAPDMKNVLDQTWRDDVVNNVVRSIETALGEVFEKTSSIAKGYAKSGKVDGRSLNALNRITARLRKMNVFSNPLWDKVVTNLESLTIGSSANSDDVVEAVIEDAILDIWEYAIKTGIKLDLSVCPFTETDLKKMLALRTSVA